MMVGVYIFHIIRMDLYKIGWSRDTSRRLEDVSKAMPFEVEQIAAWEQSEVAVVLESRLHNLFPEKRVKREWFRLTDDDISQCKQVAKAFDAESVQEERKLLHARRRLRATRNMETFNAILQEFPQLRVSNVCQ